MTIRGLLPSAVRVGPQSRYSSLPSAGGVFIQGANMRMLSIALLILGVTLSGCVAYEVPHGEGRGHHADRDRDRDGDGVPNRRDARPNDPRRH